MHENHDARKYLDARGVSALKLARMYIRHFWRLGRVHTGLRAGRMTLKTCGEEGEKERERERERSGNATDGGVNDRITSR